MHAKQGRELLVELLHVRLQEVQFRERHREQPAVEGRHIRRSPEGIARLLRRGMQPRAAECGDRGRIGLARGDGAEHPPRTRAAQVRHQRGHLDVRFLEEGLEAILQLHPIPCQLTLAPVTVRHRRCVTSGTKLSVSSCATRRFTRRSASGMSRFRPGRP